MPIISGNPIPPFTLADAFGNEVSSEQFKGGNLVIFFYPQDDTPGCTKEACGFRDLWSEIRSTGTQIVGISPDSRESHRKFIEKYQLPFVLLSDPDRAVMTEYGAYGEKMMYGRKVVGVIRSTVLANVRGVAVRHWKKVPKAADHPAKVLEAIRDSLNGAGHQD